MTTPTEADALRVRHYQRDAFVCRMTFFKEGLFRAVDPFDILCPPDDEEPAFHTRKARTSYLLSAYLCELSDYISTEDNLVLTSELSLDEIVTLAVYEERKVRKLERDEMFTPERHQRLLQRAQEFKAEHLFVDLSGHCSFFFRSEHLEHAATYFGFAAFDYDDQRRPRSKAPQTEEPVWYPDTDPDWVEVPPDQTRRPKGLKKKTRIAFLTGHERKFKSYGQVIRRAGEIAWNVTDPDVRVVAYRVAKKGD